ncbi:hypothetical protein SUGI_0784180 [Cryptomeria japonica]|nr:hypothetical protein SUGI_0784180 [Cryptomeria japonica]
MASASIHIAIFSQNYAKSPWCLTELEFMVKTCKTIIPIFYHVDTSDLRWVVEGKGAYADAFSEYEKKHRYALDVLQQWKQALQQVSFCIGEIIKNDE